MEKIWKILIIVAANIAVAFGLRFGGIPGPMDLIPYVGPVLLGILGLGIVITILVNVSQEKLKEAGLDAIGRATKSKGIKDFDKKSGRGHLANLRNKLLNRKKWEWPSGYEPKSFEDNRLLIFVLQDHALRLDTFLSKWYMMKNKFKSKFVNLNHQLERFGSPNTRSDLRREIKEYRSGSAINKDISGWTSLDNEVIEVINETAKKMIEAIKIVNELEAKIAAAATESEKETLRSEIEERTNEIINDMNAIKSRIVSANIRSGDQYGEFLRRLKPFGVHHEIRSYLLNLNDTYNPAGEYKHYYIVTKAGARFRRSPYLADERDTENATEGIEVDLSGVYVDEKNKRDVEESPILPRKLLNPRAMSQFIPNFIYFSTYLENSWNIFLRNFRSGDFAAKSRAITDYSAAFKSKVNVYSNDDAVPFSGAGGIRFDRRALSNPGKIPFKGARDYKKVDSVMLDEKFPTLTQAGITMFLEELARAAEIDSERVLNDFFAKFPEDKMTWPNSEEELIGAISNASTKERDEEDGNN